MTRRFCEDFVQGLNLHAEEEPLRRPCRLSTEDRKKKLKLEFLAKKEMALANISERIRLDLHAAEPPLRPRFCQERKKDLELLAKKKILHREEPIDDGLFPSITTLTPDELRDKMRKLLEAEEEAVDKLYVEEDQHNRELLYASLRNFHTTYKALAQLEADAFSVI